MWWFKKRAEPGLPKLEDYEVRKEVYIAGVRGAYWHENPTLDKGKPEKREMMGKVYLKIDEGSTTRAIFEDTIPVPLTGDNNRLKAWLERHGLNDHTDWETFYALMEPVLAHYRGIFEEWKRSSGSTNDY